MNPILRKVLGRACEAEEHRGNRSIIPDDAEDTTSVSDVVGKPLNPIKSVVQEPSKPAGEKEKYLTPYSALTAPDCTPDSMQPIDPSRVPRPGPAAGPERFTAADLEAAAEAPESPDNNLGQRDPAMQAMDVILGHRRVNTPPKDRPAMDGAGTMATESGAASFVANMSVNESAIAARAKMAAANSLATAQGGASMPPPSAPVDISTVTNRFREFLG